MVFEFCNPEFGIIQERTKADGSFDLRESLRRGRRVDAQRDGIARRGGTAHPVARTFRQLGREEQRRMALIIFKRGEKLREHEPVCCRQQQIDGQIVAVHQAQGDTVRPMLLNLGGITLNPY